MKVGRRFEVSSNIPRMSFLRISFYVLAVKEEIRQQNKNLMAQREQYFQKFNSLNEELSKLKSQKKEIMEGKKSQQQESFVKENERLQVRFYFY